MRLVVGDSDAIIALGNPDDEHHAASVRIAQRLHEEDGHIIFPASAIAEAITTMQRKLSSPAMAAAGVQLLQKPTSGIVIEAINHTLLNNAAAFFDPKGSKKNTFFDCIVAELARQHRADAIFSFDGWYAKLGFTLAADVF